MDRGRLTCGNFPISFKAAEMVETHHVEHLERCPHALNPPTKTISQHPLPVVERITPELSGGAEIVRRYAGHNNRPPIRLELELIRISPDICRVLRHKDRNIANEADAALVAIGLERKPLPEEKKLIELMRLNLLVQISTSTRESGT